MRKIKAWKLISHMHVWKGVGIQPAWLTERWWKTHSFFPGDPSSSLTGVIQSKSPREQLFNHPRNHCTFLTCHPSITVAFESKTVSFLKLFTLSAAHKLMLFQMNMKWRHKHKHNFSEKSKIFFISILWQDRTAQDKTGRYIHYIYVSVPQHSGINICIISFLWTLLYSYWRDDILYHIWSSLVHLSGIPRKEKRIKLWNENK